MATEYRHSFREDGSHYNGGAEFFGYGYRDPAEPRLKLVRRWYRQGKRRGQSEDHLFVDGARVESYAAAIEALRSPPVLTDEERPFLALFGDEPGPRPSGDVELIFGLREKGFVRAADRLWQITDAGRAALASPTPQDERA